jgi:hypothetical protein
MQELRVPTVALTAEVFCTDGHNLHGRIFVPASVSLHSGPMRAAEWLNQPQHFFPFLPDDDDSPVILNKHEVVSISVPASADEGDIPEGVPSPERRVAILCGERRLEGTIALDMPQGQGRVLDYLNRPELFLTLRDGERHHLVHKRHISRVVETRQA